MGNHNSYSDHKFFQKHHPHPSLPPRRGRVRVGGKISPAVNSYSPNQKIFSDIQGFGIHKLCNQFLTTIE